MSMTTIHTALTEYAEISLAIERALDDNLLPIASPEDSPRITVRLSSLLAARLDRVRGQHSRGTYASGLLAAYAQHVAGEPLTPEQIEYQTQILADREKRRALAARLTHERTAPAAEREARVANAAAATTEGDKRMRKLTPLQELRLDLLSRTVLAHDQRDDSRAVEYLVLWRSLGCYYREHGRLTEKQYAALLREGELKGFAPQIVDGVAVTNVDQTGDGKPMCAEQGCAHEATIPVRIRAYCATHAPAHQVLMHNMLRGRPRIARLFRGFVPSCTAAGDPLAVSCSSHGSADISQGVPAGLVHLTSPRNIAATCDAQHIAWLPALVGFDEYKRSTSPRLQGVVIREIDKPRIDEALKQRVARVSRS